MNPEIKPNENGCYPRESGERIFFESKKSGAEIFVMEIPTGWITSCGCDHHQGSYCGMSEPLRANPCFPSRAEAIKFSANRIIRIQNGVLADTGSCTNEGQRYEARKIIQWASELINGKLQTELHLA